MVKSFLAKGCCTCVLGSNWVVIGQCNKFNISLVQLLNIYELNSYQIGLFMYSYTKGSLPSAFSNYFSSNNNIHKHYTRSSEQFLLKFTRTNYGRFSIKYKGPMIWNSLPDVLKNIKSLQMLRKEFKTSC